ncbi:hypothetical protein VTL71DRAFT_104 [Oculimacula yallundae]|uniref:ATP-dependent DNA helicase n=1 Tax=Oculimacula yallundae TaxID=86028 RepID=A0ABR4CZ37_9HELO
MARKVPRAAYVVFRGRRPGIYRTWKECEAQVHKFPDQRQRGFDTLEEAHEEWQEWQEKQLKDAEELIAARRPVRIPEVNRPNRLANTGTTTKPVLKRQHCVIDLTEPDDKNPPPSKKQHLNDPISDDGPVPEAFPRVALSEEQEVVAQLALDGHNIFLTGAGGCGKTITIREIMYRFAERGTVYQVVCPTGIAALPLEGRTIHSWMGWNTDSMRATLQTLKVAPYSEDRLEAFRAPSVIIIEEISMVENQFLERMNLVLQEVLGCDKPFGGKQIIILGDFHQLPPVKAFEFCLDCGNTVKDLRAKNKTCTLCLKVFPEGEKWAFKAPVWKALNLRHVRLEKIHRQKSAVFKTILDKIRYSQDLEEDEWKILERKKTLPTDICAVRLMPTNSKVDNINERELAAIKQPSVSWYCQDRYQRQYYYEGDNMPDPWIDTQPLKQHRFPESIELKIGAKVVLLHNIDIKKGLVNGAQGVVESFQTRNSLPIKPSFHRVPGKAKIRGPGPPTRYQTLGMPIVRFTNGRTIPIMVVESTSRYGTNERPYLATRVQIPLKLAWALTIHKSQGMTLDFIEVSSDDMFEKGQLYVALSRGTNIEGVTLTGKKREQLSSDNTVLEFYRDTEWETFEGNERKAAHQTFGNSEAEGDQKYPGCSKSPLRPSEDRTALKPSQSPFPNNEIIIWDPPPMPSFKTAQSPRTIHPDDESSRDPTTGVPNRYSLHDVVADSQSEELYSSPEPELKSEPEPLETSKYFAKIHVSGCIVP